MIIVVLSGRSRADELQVNFSESIEAVVGQNRVVLLSLTRTTEFIAPTGDSSTNKVKTVRVMYLVERIGGGKIGPLSVGVDAYSAGTTEEPFNNMRNVNTAYTSENFGGYLKRMSTSGAEWKAPKLPSVKNADNAVVCGVTFYDVQCQ